LLTFAIASSVNASANNRIVGKDAFDRKVIPSTYLISPEECVEDQQHALESGCISEDEHKTLIEINAAPSCSKSGKLMSWGACKESGAEDL